MPLGRKTYPGAQQTLVIVRCLRKSTTGVSYVGKTPDAWESTTKSSVENERYVDGKITAEDRDWHKITLFEGEVYSYRLRHQSYGKFRVDNVDEKTLTRISREVCAEPNSNSLRIEAQAPAARHNLPEFFSEGFT